MTRELGHRHDLDRRDADRRELAEVGGGRLERPLLGERADVQFVDDELAGDGIAERGAGVIVGTADGPRNPFGCEREHGSASLRPSSTNQ